MPRLLSDQVDEKEVAIILRELEAVLGSNVPMPRIKKAWFSSLMPADVSEKTLSNTHWQ